MLIPMTSSSPGATLYNLITSVTIFNVVALMVIHLSSMVAVLHFQQNLNRLKPTRAARCNIDALKYRQLLLVLSFSLTLVTVCFIQL